MITDDTIRQAIMSYCENNKVSRKQLADMCGFSRALIDAFMSGHSGIGQEKKRKLLRQIGLIR